MHTGRPAVFCRLSGCNLWTGREEDRVKAICNFCDTDFVGTDGVNGGRYEAVELAKKVYSIWGPNADQTPYVVCTGGEPLLQLDAVLVEAFHEEGIEIGIETNGSLNPPEGIDWICVSPKPNVDIKLTTGNELKLIYPQKDISPEDVSDWDFEHFFLQPMENKNWDENTKATIAYCLEHPKWRLSLQTHKYIGIP